MAGAGISLPGGGGALRGIGETFAPDLFTGTGNARVPIALPPGRAGLAPQLSLTYSTGHGNGPFGLGWTLSLPRVARKTSHGVPRYDDERDLFLLSGAEDLVPVAPGRYRPRTEGLFALIDHERGDGGDTWTARSVDGLTVRYGTPRPDGAGQDWEDPCAIADPEATGRRRVFAWLPSATVDALGNRVEYSYLRDRDGAGDPFDQLYLSEIRYADYERGGERRFLVRVALDYEERPDPISDRRPGFEVRTRLRCTAIRVHVLAGDDLPVRTYRLVYLDQRSDQGDVASQLPRNRVSLLDQVSVLGADGQPALPPIELRYTAFAPDRSGLVSLSGRDLPARSLADRDLALVDLFGRGLPDLLETGPAVRFWRNRGDGSFDEPREMTAAPAGLALSAPGVRLMDANGDGRPELVVSGPELSGYFLLGRDGQWDRRSFRPVDRAPSFELGDPDLHLVDLDGDGVTDAVRSGPRLECFFQDPAGGWTQARSLERRSLDRFPDLPLSDPRVRWADMSGDGLADVVLISDGNVEVWPSLGHGRWGRRLSMRGCPRFPDGYDPRRILLGDVDGDGLADLIYVDHGKVTLWINRSGRAWSEPIEIDGTPPVTSRTALELVDLRGTGVAGVLFAEEAGADGQPRAWFLDLTGGGKPYLLSELDNHIGAVTRIEYATSTRFYLEDEADRRTRWRTSLPFPVQVVARVEVDDRLSGGRLTQEYSYHHGYWDGAEREFRGFGRVDRRDSESFERHRAASRAAPLEAEQFSPPVETRTWFHLGPVGDERGEWEEVDLSAEHWAGDRDRLERPPALREALRRLPRRDRRDALRALRGSALRSEVYARDGGLRQDRPYTVVESLYGVREESAPGPTERPGRRRVFFPHLVAQRTTQWERGADPMTSLSFHGDHDQHGHARRLVRIACPRGWRELADAGDGFIATATRIEFAAPDDGDVHLRDRVARSTTFALPESGTVASLRAAAEGGSALSVLAQTIHYYDGEAFAGLPCGRVGRFGLLTRSESLVCTAGELEAAYAGPDGPGVPPYLVADQPAWTDDYPAAFRAQLAPRAGLVAAAADGIHAPGLFATTASVRYDVQTPGAATRSGLVLATRDALGNQATVEYDPDYRLLPVRTVGPLGLAESAAYDLRFQEPVEMVDVNGNRALFAYTPLGLLEAAALAGKPGAPLDSLADPSFRAEYDFFAFQREGQPISVRWFQRVHRASDAGVPADQRDQRVETLDYSDGFGRLLQSRQLAADVLFGDPVFGGGVLPAEQGDAAADAHPVVGRDRGPGDPPHVRVSGWRTHDNKGAVVEVFEPFFDLGWAYRSRAAADAEAAGGGPERARHRTVTYRDPLGRVHRTVYADGTEARTLSGVPGTIAAPDLGRPDRFEPTPWEVTTYDGNDLAPLSAPASAVLVAPPLDHHFTPASVELDPHGRVVRAVDRNGASAADRRTASVRYDRGGRLAEVTDEFGRVALRTVHDTAGRQLAATGIDTGTRWVVHDACGREVERRDQKGALLLHAYDAGGRRVATWARDRAGEPVTLRERLVYGDDPAAGLADPAAGNHLGSLYRHHDEAGRVTVESYDADGNPLEEVRELVALEPVRDAAAAADGAFRIDWQPPPGSTLEEHASALLGGGAYRLSRSYDAVGRVVRLLLPEDVEGRRRELRQVYGRDGEVERVLLDDQVVVEHLARDADGEVALLARGNGVLSRYAYDPAAGELARLRSERYTRTGPAAFQVHGPVLQDCAYRYDPVGNLVAIRDRAPGSGVPNSALGVDELDRAFAYDPLYFLRSATGREHDRPPAPAPWDDPPLSHDPGLTRAYRETYTYDAAGNLVELAHQAAGGSFTRIFTAATGANRIASLRIGQDIWQHSFDGSGNLVGEGSSRRFEWDHGDQLRAFRVAAGGSPSLSAQHVRAADGERVLKLVRKQGGGRVEVTASVDGVFEHRRVFEGAQVRENNLVRVSDGETLIATVRIGPALDDDSGPAVQYHLDDHLGSSAVVVDGAAGWIRREEHTPYGDGAFGGFRRKRWRFAGCERDEESGLCEMGARPYAPWLGRFVTPDPIGSAGGLNLYAYAAGNPATFTDESGTAPRKKKSKHRPGQAKHRAELLRRIAGEEAWKHGRTERGWLKNEQRRTKSRSPYRWRMPHAGRNNRNGTYDDGHPMGKRFADHGHAGPGKLEYKIDNSNKNTLESGKRIRRRPAPLPEPSGPPSTNPRSLVPVAEMTPRATKAGAEVAEGAGDRIAKMIAKKGAKFVPGVGSGIGVIQGIDNFRQGNYVEGVLDIAGAIPGPIGDVFDGISIGYSIGKIVIEEAQRGSEPPQALRPIGEGIQQQIERHIEELRERQREQERRLRERDERWRREEEEKWRRSLPPPEQEAPEPPPPPPPKQDARPDLIC